MDSRSIDPARVLAVLLLLLAASCAGDDEKTPASDARADVTDADNARGDAGSDRAVEVAPTCAFAHGAAPPDPRCGPLPAEYQYGCGCTDGVPAAVCGNGTWTCPDFLIPRAQCETCGGLPP